MSTTHTNHTNLTDLDEVRENRARRELWGVVNRNGAERGFWTRIGTAFRNRDGSWSLLFDYVPLSSETRIQMREPRERDTE